MVQHNPRDDSTIATRHAPVWPYIRVIPNGFVKGIPRRLRATLVLSPLSPNGSMATPPLYLSSWPAELAEKLVTSDGKADLSVLKLRIANPKKGSNGLHPEEEADIQVVSAAREDFVEAFYAERAAITALWSSAICPPDGSSNPCTETDPAKVWTTLADRIAAGINGTRTTPKLGERERTPDKKIDESLGADGQYVNRPAPDKREVVAVFGIPHSDAALSLEAQRARELAYSIADQGVETPRELPQTDGDVAGEIGPFDPKHLPEAAEGQPNEIAIVFRAATFSAPPFGFVPKERAGESADTGTTAETDAGDKRDARTVAERTADWEREFARKYLEINPPTEGTITEEDVADENEKARQEIAKLNAWRLANAAALSAARDVLAKAAIRMRKVARYTALDAALEQDRSDAKEVYEDAKNALKNNELLNHCTYAATATAPERAAGEGAQALKGARIRSEYGLWPQYSKETKTPTTGARCSEAETKTYGDDPSLASASQAYFSIDSSPGQARVFGLALDVEIDLPEVATGWTFAVLSATFGDRDADPKVPRPWTLTKLQGYDGSTAGVGWPAARGEFLAYTAHNDNKKVDNDQDKRAPAESAPAETKKNKSGPVNLPAHCIGQFGGVVVMGGIPLSTDGGARLPRYDIATLDVATALEAEKAWLEAIEEKRDLLGVGEDDPLPDIPEADDERLTLRRELRKALSVGPDYQSNGLTLLCRSVVGDAIRKLAARTVKLTETGSCVVTDTTGACATVLDAEDVTSGMRAFIGVPISTTETRWRPLTGRYFTYGEGSTSSVEAGRLVERLLTAAIGPAGSRERTLLESALTAIPARDVRPAGASETVIEAIVEETVTQWDGSPAGVACAALPADDDGVPDIMPYGRRSHVPNKRANNAEAIPPNLRIGRPYRFALQAVYAGGGAVDLADEDAPGRPKEETAIDGVDLDENDVRARLFYPSAGLVKHTKPTTLPYVRALRHTRVGAPALLIPEGSAARRQGPMGYESAGKMIVRTLLPVEGETPTVRDKSRETPTLSQRVLVIPHLPLATSARHLTEGETPERGVLDRYEGRRRGPPGGLENVIYREGRDGFPTAKATFRSGFGGTPYVDRREIDPKGATANRWETASSVFARDRSNRRTDYYPDPAADTLVIRARHAAGDGARRALLDETPRSIKLRPDGGRYPDGFPVLLTLDRRARRKADEGFDHAGVIKDEGIRWIEPNRYPDVRGGGSIRVRSIRIVLEPGEEVDLEAWIVPSALRLGRDFAVVQGLLQYLCNRGAAVGGDCNRRALADGIDDAFDSKNAAELKAALSQAAAGKRYVGPGADILPETGIIRAMADELHRRMLQHPLPEIAAMRTLTAVHAVNVPRNARPLACAKPHQGGLAVKAREAVRALCAGQPPAPVEAIRPAEGAGGAIAAGSADIVHGSRALVLTGAVRMDLAKMDTLEITAETEAPETTVFDNAERGRSLAHRMAGTWPRKVQDPQTGRDPLDVFGFRVAADGRVQLPTGRVSLIRIEGLPLPPAGALVTDVDLKDYFSGADPRKRVLVSGRHQFPDGKARRLRLSINGLARTAEYLTTAARVAQAPDPWMSTEGLIYGKDELIPAETLPRRLQQNLAKDPPVITMPATIRPSMVEAKAPVPVFEVNAPEVSRENGILTLTHMRRSVTRLRMRRGWFSSGVDEKLGLVVWPPEQLLSDHSLLARNRIPLRDETFCGEVSPELLSEHAPERRPDRIVPLDAFADEDLGPGGVFVTRRASDPVRMAPHVTEFDERQIFLSKEAFPDLWRHPLDPARAEFVPHALMPLADTEAAATSGERPDTTPPMAVGLVTYEPRFDIEREEWYADVTMTPGRSADPFVRFGLVRFQPHTVPELRCSRPLVQWAQPLPERRVSVVLDPAKQDAEIIVEGPISAGRAPEPIPATCGADGAEALQEAIRDRERPVLRLTAFEDGLTPCGADGRNLLELSAMEIDAAHVQQDRFTCDIAPRIVDGEGRWTARIPVRVLQALDWRVKLSLEELEFFLPADFGSAEPIPRDYLCATDDPIWRESGARFATVIDLAALALEMSGSH
ncbi:MAG: hypothetical protein AAF865_01945 [Pseudomonadota bacterium]